MRDRRRLLLTLLNQGVWLPYSFEYLYHDLIPTKLNKNELLPQEYQEVEYIESTGTQYIDAGISTSLTEQTKYECEIGYWAITTASQYMGADYGAWFGVVSSIYTFGISTQIQANSNDYDKILFEQDFSNSQQIITINGVSVSRSYNNWGTYQIWLLNLSTSTYNCKCRLKTFKIYQNNLLVRNFIPCYRKSDNVIGLYDIVNGVFYTNAGTGTFTKGNDVYRNVKNKAKITTIYGNSVVENQWCPLCFDTTTYQNVVVSTSNGGRKATFSGTSTGYWTYTLSFGTTIPIGRKVLVSLKIKNPNNLTFGYRLREVDVTPMEYSGADTLQLRTLTTQINCIQFYGNPNLDYTGCEIEDVQVIDLTQEYPFDTPTTLTDNRVQNILNNGYIPYNSGELKSVDIGEFSSEPYNLFDGELEFGLISNGNAVGSSANGLRTKEYISVIGGKSYTWENDNSISFNGFYVSEYDIEKTFIKETRLFASPNNSITLTNNTCFIKFHYFSSTEYGSVPTNPQICFHRTGTRTGYAPHTQPQTISFKYQGGGVGTSHDTMTIDKDNVVFTKDRALVDLGQQTWTFTGGQGSGWWQTTISNMKYVLSNLQVGFAIADNYQPRTASGMSNANNNSLAVDTSNLKIRTNGNTDSSVKPTGTLEYQLATPQVITIPRKKLGVVDLGSLNWTNYGTYGSGNLVYCSSIGQAIPTGSSTPTIYCNKYISATSNGIQTDKNNRTIASLTNGQIWLIDSELAGLTNAQIQAKLSGQYLYYETQDEVADIIDTIGVEAGGTFTANWFSWVENQLVNNGNFESTSGWTAMYGTLSASNNVGTFTAGANISGSARIQQDISTLNGHKYLIRAFVKPSIDTWFRFMTGAYQNVVPQTKVLANTKTELSAIFTSTENATIMYFYCNDGTTMVQGDTAQYSNIVIIDLTIAFGSGNEPTSISDTRIQKILEMDYIPTNTTGTYKHVDYEVLTDVDTKIKGK